MDTFFTTLPIQAAEFIKRGGIVAFPTETVYGLGANVFDETAVAKIFEAKQRPTDNPLIAHVGKCQQISELATEITESAAKFIDKFFPGPLTLVLKKSSRVPLIATAGLDTIGVRMPRLEIAQAFLSACETPVVAPSANISGRPSPTTWQAVHEDLDRRIDCILQADATEIGLESTVVDCTSKTAILLRQGAISLEELQLVVPATLFLETVISESTRSPGLKHKHYSPKANVKIVDAADQVEAIESAGFIGLHELNVELSYVQNCNNVSDYAHKLFEFFRECDRRGIETIYCEAVEENGIGAALMDRIRRAAQD